MPIGARHRTYVLAAMSWSQVTSSCQLRRVQLVRVEAVVGDASNASKLLKRRDKQMTALS